MHSVSELTCAKRQGTFGRRRCLLKLLILFKGFEGDTDNLRWLHHVVVGRHASNVLFFRPKMCKCLSIWLSALSARIRAQKVLVR